MTTSSLAASSDDVLLRLAESALRKQGFHVETISDDIDLVLAENKYFVVAIAATSTIRDLILAESVAFDVLTRRLGSATLGPKKWDTYLILLTQERSSSEDEGITRELYSINYNTSRLRRIAHTGVDPTPDAIGYALAPFVEPKASSMSAGESDPLVSLLRTLVARGVDADLAERAITAFEQGAMLDDVL